MAGGRNDTALTHPRIEHFDQDFIVAQPGYGVVGFEDQGASELVDQGHRLCFRNGARRRSTRRGHVAESFSALSTTPGQSRV